MEMSRLSNAMRQDETIGNLTSSEPLKSAGIDDKNAAVEEMRAAKNAAGGNTTQNPTVGKVEAVVGGAVGCEGMEEEGKNAAAARR
ncbi:hypothetical protein MMC24_002412 [Lignoscripta atroalba]|nr:hypothetical protein [Lignoscripta atroalba]